ncbi:MAG: hypothetical protein GY754_34020 [bacterium]|nr:hypothetical protein [bacterium]
MYKATRHARIEFYLKDKSEIKHIIDRVHIIYNEVDYSINNFLRTFFNGDPYNLKENITGEDILKLINDYAEKLYPEEYKKLEVDTSIHTALKGETNTWQRKLLFFLGKFFKVNDTSTWDIDINEGIISYAPEEGPLQNSVRQDLLKEKKER